MQSVIEKKPHWLKKKIHLQETRDLQKLFATLNLNTVCKQALCPNIGECFSKKVATFLIMGKVCTRTCAFCAVKNDIPEKIDSDEPKRIIEAVNRLGLKYVVLTSVTRDDLQDGGAQVFYETVKALKSANDDLKVEVLVPDFNGNYESIEKVMKNQGDLVDIIVKLEPLAIIKG